MTNATKRPNGIMISIRKLDDPQLISLSCQSGMHFIDKKEILYCQADGSYTTIYMLDGKQHMASTILKTVCEQLGDDFLRVHQSYTVNSRWIQQYHNNVNSVELIEGSTVPVAKLRKKAFLGHFDRI